MKSVSFLFYKLLVSQFTWLINVLLFSEFLPVTLSVNFKVLALNIRKETAINSTEISSAFSNIYFKIFGGELRAEYPSN